MPISDRKIFELSAYGVYLRSRKNDLTYKYAIEGHYGDFISSILKGISQRTVFLDIGSNIGLYSLLASRNSLIQKIHSFEPDSVTFRYLTDNVAHNLSPKINPHNVAIGPWTKEIDLYQTYGHSGGASLIVKEESFNRFTKKVRMIDHLVLNKLIVGVDITYLVKIDVEGFELEVFQTLLKAEFFGFISSFIIEFDDDYGTVNELTNLLKISQFREEKRSGQGTHWDAYWVKI